MKKRMAFLMAGIIMAVSVTGCSGKGSEESKAEQSQEDAGVQDTENFKVTFITTDGGLGDRSFNDTTWLGVQKAGEELGIEVSVLEPKSVADFGTTIVSAVNNGSDMILGFGASWTDAFDEYCEKFPEVYFGGLNCNAQADNLQVAMTSDHEGSFLAGALAALKSESGIIGAVGGQDADNINRFFVGYEEGAHYVNPETKVLKSYVGSYNDPAKGKEYALQLMNEGADIIFQAAGGTGEGVFEAAKESEGLYAIGCDTDQDYIVEGKILTSMVKNCDVIAFEMIKETLEGNFEGGNKVYGLANDGVGLSSMTYTKDYVGQDTIDTLDEIKEKIISGEIQVTDIFAQ